MFFAENVLGMKVEHPDLMRNMHHELLSNKLCEKCGKIKYHNVNTLFRTKFSCGCK